MSTDFHIDNHYLPRLYLKPWVTTSGKVWTYRGLVAHESVPVWKEFSSKSIGHHRHLYTRQTVGKESDEIERWLDREFETPAEEPLQKALLEKRLTPYDWKCLVRFLAAQDVRTPAWFAYKMRQWNKTLPDLMKKSLETSLKNYEESQKTGKPIVPAPPTENRDQLPMAVRINRNPAGGGEIGVEMLAGRKLWLWSMQRALTRTLSILHTHRWTILRSPENTTWLTSDNPVVRLNLRGPSNYNFDGGWNSRGTCIFLPLGPHHLLYTQVGERPPRRGERMLDEDAELVRRCTAEHAWRTIFAIAPDGDVSILKPRIINPSAVQREQRLWQSWNEDQTKAELEME